MKIDPMDFIEDGLGKTISIANGRKVEFVSLKRYSRKEVEEYLRANQLTLPEIYIRFLTQIGACDLYRAKLSDGNSIFSSRVFLPIEELMEYNRDVSPEIFKNISRFIVVGSDFGSSFFCFDLTRRDKNFGVFTTDIYAEEWQNETEGWYDFEDWLGSLIKREGKILHSNR